MTVFRRVMQILWLLVVAALAAGLIKLAFFPDGVVAADPVEPGGQLVEPHWTVGTGTVSNDVTLTGTVAADEARDLVSTLNGVVLEVYVGVGSWIDAGYEVALVKGEAIDGNGRSYETTEYVYAPVSGTISAFPTLRGSSVSIGGSVGKIAPASFHVTGTIPPEQLYRLVERPSEATVTVNGGPAPFTCTGLQIITPLAGSDSQGSGGPTLRCAVPSDVTVFAGLSAEVVIAGGIAADVVVVPTSAVLGRSGTGIVHLVRPDGTTEEREIELGINDGSLVEVISGLKVGDEILQFVPGAPAEPGGGMIGIPVPLDGGMTCEVLADGSEVCTGVGG